MWWVTGADTSVTANTSEERSQRKSATAATTRTPRKTRVRPPAPALPADPAPPFPDSSIHRRVAARSGRSAGESQGNAAAEQLDFGFEGDSAHPFDSLPHQSHQCEHVRRRRVAQVDQEVGVDAGYFGTAPSHSFEAGRFHQPAGMLSSGILEGAAERARQSAAASPASGAGAPSDTPGPRCSRSVPALCGPR